MILWPVTPRMPSDRVRFGAYLAALSPESLGTGNVAAVFGHAPAAIELTALFCAAPLMKAALEAPERPELAEQALRVARGDWPLLLSLRDNQAAARKIELETEQKDLFDRWEAQRKAKGWT